MITRPMIRAMNEAKFFDRTGVEVGVLRGSNARDIIRNVCPRRLYLVDRYETYDGYTDYASEMEDARDEATKVLSEHRDVVQWLIMDSIEAVNHIREQIDFVYIDANRSYKSTMDNIYAYCSIMRPGGWIGGPGYDSVWPDVVKAVDEFSTRYWYTLHVRSNFAGCENRDWWIVKGE